MATLEDLTPEQEALCNPVAAQPVIAGWIELCSAYDRRQRCSRVNSPSNQHAMRLIELAALRRLHVWLHKGR